MATTTDHQLLCGCPPAAATVRVVTPGGAGDMCVLHAIALVGGAGEGASLTVLVDVGSDYVCPGCARLRPPGTTCVCGF